MESILTLSLTQNTSDLHLSSHQNIFIRQNGNLVKTDYYLDAQQLQCKLFSILKPEQLTELETAKQLDFAYEHCDYGRFRVNIFYQKRGISASFRVIKSIIPTLDDIAAPEIFKELALKKQGLILITGATGSGKTTSLATIIEHINIHQAKHIITLEDPIEFIYSSKKSLIQQRQISQHCHCFLDGLKAILRQDPDIIVIGELRDHLTIDAALQAAGTGHIVFATLHTNSAISTINRIIDVFPEESKQFIRCRLANCLQAIISQRLVFDEILQYRRAEFEILINIPAVSNLILEGKIKQIVSIMQTGGRYGMQLNNKIGT